MKAARVLLAVSTALCLGCVDDERPPSSATTSPPVLAEGFVFFAITESPEGRLGYVQHLDDIEGPSQIDNADALEITGNARVYVPGDGRVLIGSGEAPTITAYTIEPDGGSTLRPGPVVSVANFGFAAAPFGHVFVDAERALLFGDDAVRWKHDEMLVEGDTSLDDALRGGRVPQAGTGVRRGDLLFVPVAYAPFPNIDDRLYVMVFDAETLSLLEVLEDERCQQTGALQLADDGTIYVASDNGFVLPRFGSDLVKPSCVLRILPGASDFDPDWSLDLRAITGGDDATGFVWAAPGVAFIFVLEASLVPEGADDDPRLFYESASSRWWRLDLETASAAPLAGVEPVVSGSGISSPLASRGTVMLALPSSFPASRNRFVEVDPQGRVTPRFSFTGRGQLFDLATARAEQQP